MLLSCFDSWWACERPRAILLQVALSTLFLKENYVKTETRRSTAVEE